MALVFVMFIFFYKNRFDQLIAPLESTFSRRECEQHKPSEEDLKVLVHGVSRQEHHTYVLPLSVHVPCVTTTASTG